MMARTLAVAALFMAASPAPAAANSAVTVEKAWARASLGTSRPAAAYATLRNGGDMPIALVGVETDVSQAASLHESTTTSDGIARMRPVEALTILGGGAVALAPGEYHVMLMGLTRTLVEGETFTASFVFSDGTEFSVAVPVLGIGARGPEGPPAE